MNENFKVNKPHILISSSIGLFIAFIAGSAIGLKQNNTELGVLVGFIVLILHTGIVFILNVIRKEFNQYYNYFPILFIIIILIVAYLFIPTVKPYNFVMTKKIPEDILIYLDRWNQRSSLLRLLQSMLALISIICSLLVAMQLNSFKDKTIKWIAFVSALSIGVLSTFNFGEQANRIRTAWRLLNTAVIKYQYTPEYSMEELLDKYYEAENMIGETKIDLK